MSVYRLQSQNVQKTWLLIFLFVGLVSALFFGFATYFNSPILAIVGLLISLTQAGVAYFSGDKIALSSVQAVPLTVQKSPQIHIMVENLSKIAGIPKPQIYLSPDASANAFACGRNPEHASICLNQGLLNLLDKNELEGVIAHELAHIKNRDILIMTVTMVLTSIVSFLADIGTRAMLFSGSRDNEEKSNPIAIILYIVVLVLAPIVSTVIAMAVSRSREYLADATAVVFTRYPDGLISALQKLYASPTPTSYYATSMNHFYISPPKKKFGEKLSGLFSTHPSIEERVKALQQASYAAEVAD